MAHHKRKRSKRSVRCTMCTQDRWKGNSSGRFKAKDEAKRKNAAKEIATAECCGLLIEDCCCEESRMAG